MKEGIEVMVEVEEVYRVGKEEMKMTVIKLQCFEQRVEILKQKSKLEPQKMYI